MAARGARGLIRGYQLTLSAFLGRQCRHLPSCSSYADEAIARHGLWAGGWMGVARICRCHPWGSSGLDFVPANPPAGADWRRPWSYGCWRGTNPIAPERKAAPGEASAAAEGSGDAVPPAGPGQPAPTSNAAAAASNA
nr:membrane protein insertion efficiency factor YidD [Chelatococcus reniformis]